MKKLLSLLTILLTLTSLFGCSKKKVEEVNKLSQKEVFGGYQRIQVVEGDTFNLQDWYKDSEAFTYTTEDTVDSSSPHTQWIHIKATSKDGQVYEMNKYIEIISVETLYTEGNLTLQTGKKLDDLAVKEGYSITYEGDIDYNTPGDYLIKLHVIDPSSKKYTVERTITITEEPVKTLDNDSNNATYNDDISYSGDNWILQKAYEYEKTMTGTCSEIAERFIYETKGIFYKYYDFNETSNPQPGDLVEYRYNYGDGYVPHIAVYVGDGKCMHGGYNGYNVKVTSCTLSEYPSVTYYSTDSAVEHKDESVSTSFDGSKCMMEGQGHDYYYKCYIYEFDNPMYPVDRKTEPTPTSQPEPVVDPEPYVDPNPVVIPEPSSESQDNPPQEENIEQAT